METPLLKILSNYIEVDGIWVSNADRDVSYPGDGNAACFQIEDQSFWFQHRNACILELVNAHLEKGSLILDIGGGNGYVSKHLMENGYQTHSLELKCTSIYLFYSDYFFSLLILPIAFLRVISFKLGLKGAGRYKGIMLNPNIYLKFWRLKKVISS